MKVYDYIIVGCGFSGAVFAQQAKESGRSVLILEKRDHIGGNCYSYNWQDTNITIHKYGTHIFHTNDKVVWDYICRFTKFNGYRHRVLTTHNNRVFMMPINLGTINSFYGINLKPYEVDQFLEEKKGKIENPQNLEEKAISLIGRDLYEAFIKGYTMKQWDCSPTHLPADIITRLPIRSSYNDLYFKDKYQGIPIDGYTPIIEKLIEGVDIELGVDFLDEREHWERRARRILYTGPLDRFFDYSEGRLNWRSVRFDIEQIDVDDYQGTSVMNFADSSVPHTRIHEPKHLHCERRFKEGSTVVIKEFSILDDEEPYYPMNLDKDRAILRKYKGLQEQVANTVFVGRLSEYKYYDMDRVIRLTLDRAKADLANN